MTSDIRHQFEDFWPQPVIGSAPDKYDDLVDAIMLTIRAHWEGGGSLDGADYRRKREGLAARLREIGTK